LFSAALCGGCGYAHHRPPPSPEKRTRAKMRIVKIETRYDKVDWSNLLNEVQSKFRYLRLAWQASEREAPPALHAKMVEDLYLPAIKLLAEFCAAVEVTEEKLEE
jgi:hypothetical protein